MQFSNLSGRACALLLAAAVTHSASAGTVLTLSDLSSDETNAEVLSGTLTFEILGGSLLLTVANETSGDSLFDISAIYFNADDDAVVLTLVPPLPGWNLVFDETADGFGTFDFALIGNRDQISADIGPGESTAFTFTVDAPDPLTEMAFSTAMSVIPPGNESVVAVAKFIHGPQDDSAFGAVIPEPTSGLLSLLTVVFLAGSKRRRLG